MPENSDSRSNIPTYKFIDLFSGIGGFRFGFQPKGGTCVWSCEINPYARRTYCANHDVEDQDIFRDVKDATPQDVPDHDLLVAGFPCFARETMILTTQGYVPIQEIRTGAKVLTHLGRWRTVTSVMKRENIPTRIIKAQGIPGIVTTDEHPFYTRRIQTHSSKSTGGITCLEEAKWVPAQDLNSETRLAQVLPDPTPDDGTIEFWWLAGRYLADGYTMMRNQTSDAARPDHSTSKIIITCHPDESQELADKIRQAGYYGTLAREDPADKHIISDQKLYQWITQFGKYAHGKRLPAAALELEQAKAKAMLEGYFSGDGHPADRGTATCWEASSTSKALALGIALLSQRVYGVVATVMKYQPAPTKEIQGRLGNQPTRWVIRIPTRNHSAIIEGKYGWKKVHTNEPTCKAETVWNISVEEDESYVADGAVVHNCQPFSLAGVSKNNALQRAHGFNDQDRGTMFFHILRLLATHRPAAFLLENVPNLLRHDNGRTFAIVQDLLQGELGYHISHRVIDARPYVPQKRRRIFIAGHLMSDRPNLEDMPLPPASSGPVLRQILHPEDGSEQIEDPYTLDNGAVNSRYTLGEGTWNALLRHREKHRNSGNGFGYTVADPNEPTRTLTARYGKDGQEILIDQPGKVRPRRLTPRECSRLMGMPELNIPVSDSQAYRQLGNSVVPKLVEDIAAHITQ